MKLARRRNPKVGDKVGEIVDSNKLEFLGLILNPVLHDLVLGLLVTHDDGALDVYICPPYDQLWNAPLQGHGFLVFDEFTEGTRGCPRTHCPDGVWPKGVGMGLMLYGAMSLAAAFLAGKYLGDYESKPCVCSPNNPRFWSTRKDRPTYLIDRDNIDKVTLRIVPGAGYRAQRDVLENPGPSQPHDEYLQNLENRIAVTEKELVAARRRRDDAMVKYLQNSLDHIKKDHARALVRRSSLPRVTVEPFSSEYYKVFPERSPSAQAYWDRQVERELAVREWVRVRGEHGGSRPYEVDVMNSTWFVDTGLVLDLHPKVAKNLGRRSLPKLSEKYARSIVTLPSYAIETKEFIACKREGREGPDCDHGMMEIALSSNPSAAKSGVVHSPDWIQRFGRFLDPGEDPRE